MSRLNVQYLPYNTGYQVIIRSSKCCGVVAMANAKTLPAVVDLLKRRLVDQVIAQREEDRRKESYHQSKDIIEGK